MMRYTLEILEPEETTQYPSKMALESYQHYIISNMPYLSKPKKYDYFVAYRPKFTYRPKVLTEKCLSSSLSLPNHDETLCPSDHVPIHMDYKFKEKTIRIISWNIQYFINDSGSEILGILQELTYNQDNYIILLQEIKQKNASNDNKVDVLVNQLRSFYSDVDKPKINFEKRGFQATIYFFRNLNVTSKAINIRRCYTSDMCERIENEPNKKEKKYSSLLLIFNFTRKESESESESESELENELLFVNNVHLVSFGTSPMKMSRFTEFNHIIKKNKDILNRIKNNGIENVYYEMIFGGDMNTDEFNKENLKKSKEERKNSKTKKTYRRFKSKLLRLSEKKDSKK